MTSANTTISIKTENLAYWYMRLNGFLTIPNFVVHHETDSDQRTEVDVLGVRFPYRAELHPTPMEDDSYFTSIKTKPFIAIAEVTIAECKLNGPWTNPDKRNLHRILRAIGAFPDASIEQIANGLYGNGVVDDSVYISLLCFGSTESERVKRKYPNVLQITWNQALNFIYERFKNYAVQKVSHGQWDSEGNNLWDSVMAHDEVSKFISSMRVTE